MKKGASSGLEVLKALLMALLLHTRLLSLWPESRSSVLPVEVICNQEY